METLSVNEIADKIVKVGSSRGHDVKIKTIKNPRIEKEEHYYNPVYQGLIDIGVEPHYLTDDVISKIFEIVEKYNSNIREDVIFRGIQWG